MDVYNILIIKDKQPIVYAALYISGPSEDVSKGVKEYINFD